MSENKGLKIKNKPSRDISEVVSEKKSEDPDSLNRPNLKNKQSSLKCKIVEETIPSPLLKPEEKREAKEYGYSLDSKTVGECIGLLDIDQLCKCVAHAILRHIEFSKGELLIDDLVEDDEDIPMFSYDFNQFLQIDLDEIQREKELREWEAEARNMENYERIQYLIQGGDPYSYSNDYNPHPESYNFNPEFVYQEDIPEECDRINTEHISYPNYNHTEDMNDPVKVEQISNTINISTGQPLSNANADINIENRSSSQVCNVPCIKMDEMLQDHKLTPGGKRRPTNSYYTNLSMMGYSKPFFFPPPELGMVESLGSYENTSRFFRSVKSSNLNRSFGKNTSVIGVSIRSKNSTMLKENETEIPLRTQMTQELFTEEVKENKASTIEHPDHKNEEISVASLESIESNFSDPEKYRTSASGEENLEEFKKQDVAIGAPEFEKLSTEENPNNLSVESYYVLEDLTKEGLQKYLKDSMIVFNEQYSIENQVIEDDIEVIEPSFDLCYRYCKYVMVASKMEKEIPLIALVYMERLLMRTGILMNTYNWRRLVLITMIIASKLWDDDSLENEHFPKVMKDVTIKEINVFERVFLDLIGYDLTVQGPEYAKYYFILSTLGEKNNIKFPLPQVSVREMLKAQRLDIPPQPKQVSDNRRNSVS